MPDLSRKCPQPEIEEGAGRKSGEKIPTEEGTNARLEPETPTARGRGGYRQQVRAKIPT